MRPTADSTNATRVKSKKIGTSSPTRWAAGVNFRFHSTASGQRCCNSSRQQTRFKSPTERVISKRILQFGVGINQRFKRDSTIIFCGARNPEFARVLNPALQSFEE